MDFMFIPKDEIIRSAADLFEWKESDGLEFRKLFAKYKDNFPMLICIQGGNYGTTRFDCFDNFQVLRIHGVSYQPRVAADDTRRVRDYKDSIITIPENTLVRFQQITGPNRYGHKKKLCEILPAVQTYPVNLVMTNDSGYSIRVGTSRQSSQDFEYMLVKERYKEPFFMMNCIDMTDLKMNSRHCMACLCDDLIASPITGFKYKSKITFEEYCDQLAKQAANSGEVYDTSDGNPDWCEHSLDDFLNLLDVCEYKEGIIERVMEEPTEDDEYEEIPPLLPDRKPVQSQETTVEKPDAAKDKETVKKSKESKQKHDHSKSKAKREEGVGGLFSKLIPHGHKAAKDPGAVDKPIPQTKPKTSESGECDENVPERPTKAAAAKVIKVALPPPRKKNVTTGNGEQSKAPTEHRDYQNTKVGRATVKPIQRVKTKDEEIVEEDIKKDTSESDDYYAEPTEYVEMYGSDKTENRQLQNKPSQYVTGKMCKQEEEDQIYEEFGECQEDQNHAEADTTPVTEETIPETQEFSLEVFNLSIDETCKNLKALKLGKYVPKFRENMIDGSVLCDLSVADMIEELKMKKLEAIRLHAYVKTGRIPK